MPGSVPVSGPRPGVHEGDHVYFNDGKAPCHGRVLAKGKHGCTIDCGDGKPRRVKWEALLGHKKRAEQNLKIVDHGEDGMIVEDAQGRRRFIGLQEPEPTERIVVKSHNAAVVIRSRY